MSSRGGGAGRTSSVTSRKGKAVDTSGSGKFDSNNLDISELNVDSSQKGEWEVIGKRGKARGGSAAAKNMGPQNSSSRGRGQSEAMSKQEYSTNGGYGMVGRTFGSSQVQGVDSRRPYGRGNNNRQPSQSGWEAAYMAPPPNIRPPLENGWQWGSRGGFSGTRRQVGDPALNPYLQNEGKGYDPTDEAVSHEPTVASDDDDDLIDDNDDELSDDNDSDTSQKSHGSRKKNKWFKSFFDGLDRHSVVEINDQGRQWHCPACQNGRGAVDWYDGLQPLLTHAKTKGSERVKLHREFAELLEEELRRRGTSVIPGGEAYGKWRGLSEETTDHDIVWPPMVVVRNTILEQDDNDKWIGMGNQELLEYFSTYAASKARHAYGPTGHRGMSLLIFESNAFGYMEAERLHKHFEKQGTDRDAWERRNKVLFCAGGKRQLYGYLAVKEDLDVFNQHSQGKAKLKYEMRSYQEMVVGQMRQISVDNQELTSLKKKAVKHEQWSKSMVETFTAVTQKLRETTQENRIVRHRTKKFYEENNEEMDRQERFFQEQLDKVHKAMEEKEKEFESALQAERANALKPRTDSEIVGKDHKMRNEEVQKLIDNQVKGVEEFEAEREKLMRAHNEKMVQHHKKHLEEVVKLERDFDQELTDLMKKYSPTM